MPCKENIKCSKCNKRIRGTKGVSFKKRMEKLRAHRKKYHPKAHKESVVKAVKTKTKGKKKGNPNAKDKVLHALSPYYTYQRQIKKKSPKEAQKATLEFAKKALVGL